MKRIVKKMRFFALCLAVVMAVSAVGFAPIVVRAEDTRWFDEPVLMISEDGNWLHVDYWLADDAPDYVVIVFIVGEQGDGVAWGMDIEHLFEMREIEAHAINTYMERFGRSPATIALRALLGVEYLHTNWLASSLSNTVTWTVGSGALPGTLPSPILTLRDNMLYVDVVTGDMPEGLRNDFYIAFFYEMLIPGPEMILEDGSVITGAPGLVYRNFYTRHYTDGIYSFDLEYIQSLLYESLQESYPSWLTMPEVVGIIARVLHTNENFSDWGVPYAGPLQGDWNFAATWVSDRGVVNIPMPEASNVQPRPQLPAPVIRISDDGERLEIALPDGHGIPPEVLEHVLFYPIVDGRRWEDLEDDRLLRGYVNFWPMDLEGIALLLGLDLYATYTLQAAAMDRRSLLPAPAIYPPPPRPDWLTSEPSNAISWTVTSIPSDDEPYDYIPIEHDDPPLGRPPITPVSWAAGASVTTALTGATVSNAVQTVGGNMMISLRVATENLLRTEPGWIGTNQPITLTGLNAAGENVTVVVTQGQTTATITVAGQSRTVDIADEVQRLTSAAGEAGTWATGSIRTETIGGSAFLPLRFVLQTFEVPFRWDSPTSSVVIG